LREEEEWGGGSGEAYYSASEPQTVDQWRKDIETASPKFPMYAIFRETAADSETVSFVEANRAELKEISGNNCCFVFTAVLNRTGLS
jgi:hypothetical protein